MKKKFTFLFLLSFIGLSSIFAQIPTNGLVAYYPFNGTINDASGNGNNGTPNGSPTWTTDRFGNANSALNFNGTSDYISVPNSQSISLNGNLGTGVSICAWIYSPTTTKQGIIGRWGGTTGIRYLLFMDASGIGDIHLTVQGLLGNFSMSANHWHFVVGSYDNVSDSLKLFIDNVLDTAVIANSPFGTTPDVALNLEIGRFDGMWYFNGKMDDIRIYNRSLNNTEISAIFHEPNPNLSNCLVAYYPFNGTTNDTSGNGNNGTPNGSPTWTTDRFGHANSALNFNGTSDYITVPNSQSISLNGNLSSGITLCTWIFTPTVAKQGIFGRWSGTTGIRYLLFMDAGGVGDIHLTAHGLLGNFPMSANNWHFVVGSYDNVTDSLKLFIDNVLDTAVIANSPFGTTPDVALNLEIGRFDGMWYFNGKMDDMRIFNCPLNNNEIDTLYHEGGWVGIKEVKTENVFSIYPNPSNDYITLKSSDIIKYALISVYNLQGQLLIQQKINQQNTSINISSLIGGMYFIKFENNKRINVSKFVKE